jgi:crotonobetainyl-CoA:carnitine CoA-transferase CaiB-like acyl-CoA transferase
MPVDAGRDGYESLVVNANKRCITLNLKSDEGAKVFERLVEVCDVVVENFAVGVMDRLGYGFEKLRSINPKIVYARSSGYGSSGPYAKVPAFAVTTMAISGWTQSGWDNAGEEGLKPLGIGDEAAGVSMALGICAALYEKEKTGVGSAVDVSMQEAQMGFMVSSFHTHFEGQEVAAAPSRCADGYVSFHMPDLNDERWSRFCARMGHPEGTEDPRFADLDARRRNFPDLMETVRSWVTTMPKAELWEIFVAEGIPGAPVLALGEAIDDAHVKERGAFVEVDHPEAGTLTMLRPWVRFSNHDTKISHAGPAIGEHNDEVYGELLGLSSAEIDELRAQGAV